MIQTEHDVLSMLTVQSRDCVHTVVAAAAAVAVARQPRTSCASVMWTADHHQTCIHACMPKLRSFEVESRADT
jgi:hypothetical protein